MHLRPVWLRCASTRCSCLALPGAVRRCGCATLSHSYTLALGPVDPVPIVTIGWLLLECQSGLWSVLSDATVYYSRALPVPQSNLARSAPIATGAAGGYWGLGSSPIPGNHPHSARAGRCHSITIYSYLHNKITYLFRHLFPSPIQQVTSSHPSTKHSL